MDCAPTEPHTSKIYNNRGVDLCMEVTHTKGLLHPNCGPMIVLIDEHVRELDDREQCTIMARHIREEVGGAIERRTYRLSDQENNH